MPCRCHYIRISAVETLDVLGDAFPPTETVVELTRGAGDSGHEPEWRFLRQAPANQLTGQATLIPDSGFEEGTDYVQTYSVRFVRDLGSHIPVRIYYEIEQWVDGAPTGTTEASVLLGGTSLETGGITVFPSGGGSENIAYLRVLYLEVPGI